MAMYSSCADNGISSTRRQSWKQSLAKDRNVVTVTGRIGRSAVRGTPTASVCNQPEVGIATSGKVPTNWSCNEAPPKMLIPTSDPTGLEFEISDIQPQNANSR